MIFWFSGTGNTRLVAERLAYRLGMNDCRPLSAAMLRNPSDTYVETSDIIVIWAFPTYSWGMPPVVADFIARFSFGSGLQRALHFMVTTCGDDMAYTDRQWQRAMHHRGLATGGAYAVQMPNTYTLMKGFDVDAPETIASKLSAMPAMIERIAAAIHHGARDWPIKGYSDRMKSDILIRGTFPLIKSGIIYPWFKRFAMSPKPFHHTDGCVLCGKCARECPMANITMETDGPRWAERCALCLRCYHICPRHAIAYGKTTDGKGQYIAPKE